MPFNSLGLSEVLIKSVIAEGYETPTEIQSRAIPIIMAGHDVIGCSRTGSGKTAAFVLPILDRLIKNPISNRKRRFVRALVVTPTRELALQVEEAARTYGRYTKIRCAAIYGGVPIEPQFRSLQQGADLVVATPGRLLDHASRGSIDLSSVELVVLDEADRMLDMGFIHDVRKIIKLLPKERQTLFFSATMPDGVRSLASGVLRQPHSIEVGSLGNPAETIEQHVYPVPRELKMDLLLHVLRTESSESVLIFSRTRRGADRIMKKLDSRGIRAAVIHSDRSQNQRVRALDGFKRGEYRVLVATDIAARGIDVDNISHVINFDTPAYAEDYIHRIGRTGRALMTGDALTFVSEDEEAQFRRIEKSIGKRLQRKTYPGFSYVKPPPKPHAVSLATYQPSTAAKRSSEVPRRENQNDFSLSSSSRSRKSSRYDGNKARRR